MRPTVSQFIVVYLCCCCDRQPHRRAFSSIPVKEAETGSCDHIALYKETIVRMHIKKLMLLAAAAAAAAASVLL